MTEANKTPALPITDPHKVQTVFVNQVVGAGQWNAVVNITLATAQFTPNAGDTVDVDLVIASRLRMDLYCAQQLHEALGKQISAAIAAATGLPANAPQANGEATLN